MLPHPSVIATQRAFRNRFNLAPLVPVPDRKSLLRGSLRSDKLQMRPDEELESLGLGIVFYTYRISRHQRCSSKGDAPSMIVEHVFAVNPLTTGKYIVYNICPSGYELVAWWGDEIKIEFDFALVKIGVPDTGPGVSKSFLFSLVYFQMVNHWSVGGYVNIVGNFNFDSRTATTCATPTASESIIHFGRLTQQQVQATAAGGVIATRNFSMNFSCPLKSNSYQHLAVSFFVDPVYGKADGVYGNSCFFFKQKTAYEI